MCWVNYGSGVRRLFENIGVSVCVGRGWGLQLCICFFFIVYVSKYLFWGFLFYSLGEVKFFILVWVMSKGSGFMFRKSIFLGFWQQRVTQLRCGFYVYFTGLQMMFIGFENCSWFSLVLSRSFFFRKFLVKFRGQGWGFIRLFVGLWRGFSRKVWGIVMLLLFGKEMDSSFISFQFQSGRDLGWLGFLVLFFEFRRDCVSYFLIFIQD